MTYHLDVDSELRFEVEHDSKVQLEVTCIVISWSEICDSSFYCAHVICINNQFCPVASMQHHYPGDNDHFMQDHDEKNIPPCFCGW